MNSLGRMLYGYIVVFILFVSTNYMLTTIFPSTHWFIYRDISIKMPVVADSPIQIESVFRWFKAADTEIVNALYCQGDDGNFYFLFHQKDNILNAPISEDDPQFSKDDGWIHYRYKMHESITPKVGSVCFIRSYMTAEVGFGIHKRFTVNSPFFTVENTPVN